MKLYANWTANQYTVSFNVDGGSALGDIVQNYDTTIATSPVSTKPGYTLVGWYTEASLTNRVSFPYTITGDKTLYAKWEVSSLSAPYFILYDGNNNTSGSAPSSTWYISGQTANVSDNTGSLARTGYTFAGWNTKSDGTGKSYPVGEKLTVRSNIVLFAMWAKSAAANKLSYTSDMKITGADNFIVVCSSNGKVIPTSYYNASQKAVIYSSPETGVPATKVNFVGFSDIDKDFWAADSIWFLSARGIVNGLEDGTFTPNGEVTRAQFAKMLACMTPGLDCSQFSSSGFSDVSTGDWFYPYVNWGFSNGIITGNDNGKFSPEDYITNEQMCVMLQRYVKYLGYETGTANTSATFSDESSVSSWAVNSVQALHLSGLITGSPDGSFNPKDFSTRAQAAAISYRLIVCILNSLKNTASVPFTN